MLRFANRRERGHDRSNRHGATWARASCAEPNLHCGGDRRGPSDVRWWAPAKGHPAEDAKSQLAMALQRGRIVIFDHREHTRDATPGEEVQGSSYSAGVNTLAAKIGMCI